MGNPIRVLHAVVNMNRGGAETLIMNLYRNMDHSSVQFDFLTCKAGDFDGEIIGMGGRIHRIPYITDGGHFQYIKALKHFFRSHPEYQVIHAHMDKMSGFVLREAKKAGIRIRISHSHNTRSEGGIMARSYKSYAGYFVKRSTTHYFSCSGAASRWLYGSKSDQATILKNGIEYSQFKFSADINEKVRRDLGIENGDFVIGHVGRFCHQKNHTFLIEIFSEIVKSNPKAYLVLVGDGPLRADVEEKVGSLGLAGKVKFLGVRTDVYKVVQTFDSLIFPSIHEGLPVTLIEAQGAGIPCLISNTITDEVDMGADLIHRESIQNPPKSWAMKIQHMDPKVNRDTRFIRNKGYDIKESASWLQDFYLETSGGSEGLREETG